MKYCSAARLILLGSANRCAPLGTNASAVSASARNGTVLRGTIGTPPGLLSVRESGRLHGVARFPFALWATGTIVAGLFAPAAAIDKLISSASSRGAAFAHRHPVKAQARERAHRGAHQ